MLGKLRHFNPLQAPYIEVNVKVASPGSTNGKPNIKEDKKYVLAPSAKKIGTYIRNQLFGSDLLTQTEGLDINWLMPTLGEALELSVYERESFIYIHKFDNKIYLECIKKCDIHNLVQRYDKIVSCDIIQDFEGKEFDYCLKRHIEIKDGNTELSFSAFRKDKDSNKWFDISIEEFNKLNGTEYQKVYVLPYEVIVNIDVGQDFFKDSTKLLNEEMEIFNTLSKEAINKILDKIIGEIEYRLKDIDLHIELTDAAREKFIEDGYDVHFGARPLKRLVGRTLEVDLSKLLIEGEIKEHDVVVVNYVHDKFVVKKRV